LQVSPNGTLVSQISIGPMQPVCYVGNSVRPPPPSYSMPQVIVSSSGRSWPLNATWAYDGCNVSGSVEASLSPGSYELNLSPCPYMGCARVLPMSFTIIPGQTLSLDVTIDTGIR
jgi:hypothetical protein